MIEGFTYLIKIFYHIYIDDEKVTIQYLSDRYLGLDDVILEIDYDFWFGSYKKDIEDNFEEYMDRERLYHR